MERNRTQLRGAALLMLTALIWGTALWPKAWGWTIWAPAAFTAVRNYIGCVALLPVIAFASRLRKGKPEDDGEQVPPARPGSAWPCGAPPAACCWAAPPCCSRRGCRRPPRGRLAF